MLVTFLFWNLMKRPFESRVARIVATHGVDVVLLAECGNCDAVLAAIQSVDPAFSHPDSRSKKIQLFTRFDPGLVDDRLDWIKH